MFVSYVYISVNTQELALGVTLTARKSSSVRIKSEMNYYEEKSTKGFALAFNAHIQDFSIRKC